jgi:hypothetical protein
MDRDDSKPRSISIVMDTLEASEYLGAVRRDPTFDELDEIAAYSAEDCIDGEITHFGREADAVERMIAINDMKKEIFKELQPFTFVLDLVKFDIQVFYMFTLSISVTDETKVLYFEDGLSKLLKIDGVLRNCDAKDDFLFEINGSFK